jgi:hypothetical protein
VHRSDRREHRVSNIVIEELEVRWSTRTMALSKGEGRFIEDDVPGDDDSICGEVKAAVPFVMSGIA